MKVLFISNSLNIHQAIFWDCFVANSDVSLVFLETDPTDNGIKEKCQRGYTMLSSKINNCDVNLFMNSFDVIIVGHCSDKRFFNFPKDKIIIHCSEHFWKKINTPISLCKRILKMIILKKRYKKVKNLFVFATSSRLFNELSAIKLNFKACYKFGYFPPVNEELDLSCKNDKSIIYAGRLIKCKRPQRSLFLLKKLQENDASYSLSYIGKGELENRLKKKAKKINNVSFGPYISHEELLLKFKQSSIFCFSSNREEGWGAVLNETLSSGCIVFADEAAGSTKYLIKDGVNGFSYKNKKELENKIAIYKNMSPSEIEKMRINAFSTINDKWNTRVAAQRLHHILKSLINNKIEFFDDGPFSNGGLKQ